MALALLGFAGIGGDKEKKEKKESDEVRDTRKSFKSLRPRLLVSVSDAVANAPERGASAYLVHNHRFRGAFVDARRRRARGARTFETAACRRPAATATAAVSSTKEGAPGRRRASTGASRRRPSAPIRGALAALEGVEGVEAEARVGKMIFFPKPPMALERACARGPAPSRDRSVDPGRQVATGCTSPARAFDGFAARHRRVVRLGVRAGARARGESVSVSRGSRTYDRRRAGTESDAHVAGEAAEKRASRAYRRDGSTFGKSKDRLSGLSADGDGESALAPRKRSASLSACT